MKKELAGLVASACSLLVIAAPLAAEPPADISYQGQLLDADGNPLEGFVNLQIRVYESLAPAPDESALFVEDHLGTEVTRGVFHITIGAGPSVSGSLGPETFEGANRYLEVHVNGERLSPRQTFSSVPYSFQASRAETTGGALHVFDALGNDLGLRVGELGVYLEELSAIVWLDPESGDSKGGDYDVFFALPGCQGQAYVSLDDSSYDTPPYQRLIFAGEPRRYFVRRQGSPVVNAAVQSRTQYGGLPIYVCNDDSQSLTGMQPLEEVTSNLPFSFPLPAPLHIGTAP